MLGESLTAPVPGLAPEAVLSGRTPRIRARFAAMNDTRDGIELLCDAVADVTNTPDGTLPHLGLENGVGNGFATNNQPAKRVRLSVDASSPSRSAGAAPNHVCQVCKRVYERADHLSRHMRSHENARQYQCSRCPKRFNRAYVMPPSPALRGSYTSYTLLRSLIWNDCD